MRLTCFMLAAMIMASAALPAASRLPERAPRGMVASGHALASEVGVDVMRRGGNAIDAAVAVGLALAVVWPAAGNLGGGGFLLFLDENAESEIIDYRERAPLAASRDMYLDEHGKVIRNLSSDGHRAVAVPGTVAGLWLAHQRHGTLPWKDLVEPARRLAADGFIINQYLERSLCTKKNRERMESFPESRRIFLRNGDCYRYGEKFVQPELASVLARIRDEGADDFYRGRTAELIVREMKENDGLITAEDLRTYTPTLREPLRTSYRGVDVLTMPPPSSGGVALIQMLGMLEQYDVAEKGWGSADHLHLLIEVMRRAFADRATWAGDTDFAEDVPIRGLTSRKYIRSRAATIDLKRATPSREITAGDPFPWESRDTTHFSIVDPQGRMVSNTYTLNSSFGSAVTVKGAGFVLNNEMDDFTAAPGTLNAWGLRQGEANAIQPRKRPLSSMTPTVLLRAGRPWVALGSPGGPGIINSVLQTIVNLVDFEMDLQEAIELPRIHHQWMPDEIAWELRGVNPDTRRILIERGHRFREKPDYRGDVDPLMGDVEAVMVDAEGHRLGGSDPRRGGESRGF